MATRAISHEVLNAPDRNLDVQESRFWIGRVAAGNVVLKPKLYNPLLKFRGDVYVHELQFLPSDALDPHGREKDEYDKRSVLFAAIENMHYNGNEPTVVGSARMIFKDSAENLLPIEKYFPELTGIQEEISGEASRHIARHPRKSIQRLITLALVGSLVKQGTESGIENVYAMMEKPFIKSLSAVGLQHEEVGDPKTVEDLNGELIPVLFKPFEITEYIQSAASEKQIRLGQYLGIC